MRDANGEERKGIEVYVRCEIDNPYSRVLDQIRPNDCWLIACGCPAYEVGISDREYKTIRDLMLAGF